MNGYLLDSDIIIDFLRRKRETVELIRSLIGKGTVGCGSLSIIEVVGGMKSGEEKPTYSFIRGLKVYSVTDKVCWIAAEEQRRLRESGITIGTVDVTQAAICLINNLVLVTSNKRHYHHIEKLKTL